MAGGDCRLFDLLCYAVCGGKENSANEVGCKETLSNIHDACLELMQRDYKCDILKNVNGHLCGTYPENLIIPLSERHPQNMNNLMDYVLKGRLARTRGRFVVPALLVNGKYVCRSSTLARSPEIYCRKSYGYWVQGEPEAKNETETSILGSKSVENSESSETIPSDGEVVHNSAKIEGVEDDDEEWLPGKMRNADINLLQFLRVDTIFDLMVENKKVKYGLNVTSSEKVDRQQRYLKFNLLGVPYPGCEFFAEYRKCDYSAEGLKFDWKQNFVDADLHIPKHVNHLLCDVAWEDYMKWDLVELTQNYLKLHLRCLMDGESKGILLHCISGWDRTPLFISLMRLSLWADGIVHQSLNVEEMVYFTVAYDWLLFSHKFSDRIANGEEIFYFCFDFLKYIYSEEYSMLSFAPSKDDHLKKYSDGSTQNGSEKASGPSNRTFVSLPQGCIDEVSERSHQSNGVCHNASHENRSDLNGIIYSEWENSTASNDVDDPTGNRGGAVSEAFTEELGALNVETPAKLEVSSCDVVQPGLSKFSMYAACHEQEEFLKGTVVNVCGSEEPSESPKNTRSSSISREEKLQAARELVVENYQAAVRWLQEQQQATNSGFAASLFSHLSSFVKR